MYNLFFTTTFIIDVIFSVIFTFGIMVALWEHKPQEFWGSLVSLCVTVANIYLLSNYC